MMNIFVSRLNTSTKSDDLLQVFGTFGTVSSAKVTMDNVTGRSRGFGFVEMESDDEGQNAIQELHNSELNGRTITVKRAPSRV